MDKDKSLSHSAWQCKWRVVFIPKCRRKTLHGNYAGIREGGSADSLRRRTTGSRKGVGRTESLTAQERSENASAMIPREGHWRQTAGTGSLPRSFVRACWKWAMERTSAVRT